MTRPQSKGRPGEAGEDTRKRILDAARDLLAADEGILSFSVDAVARRAGVARMTVYYQFGSRRELFEALFDRMASDAGFDRLPEVFTEGEGPEAVKAFVRFFCAFWERDRIVARRLRALAALDPELGAALAGRDQRRKFGARKVLERFEATSPGGLPAPIENLAARMHAVTLFDVYDNLRSEMSPAEATAAVEEITLRVVLPPLP